MEAPRFELGPMTASRRLYFLLFMLLCVALFATLGVWQVKRLHWKENLIARLDEAYAAPVRSVAVGEVSALKPGHFIRGDFTGIPDLQNVFFLSGQIDEGKQTAHTMLPFILSGDVRILVDLGPGIVPPASLKKVTLTGLLKNAPLPNRFTPANDRRSGTWYSIDVSQLNVKNLKPLVLIPETTPWKNYGPRKPELRNAHLQYAIFWFAMAVITSVLTAYYLARKPQ